MIKLTEQIKANIIHQYVSGLKQIKIAELNGLSVKTINRYIRSTSLYKSRREIANIKALNKLKYKPDQKIIDSNEVIDLYMSGSSIHELCIKYKIGNVKIKNILKDNNIKIRNLSESLSLIKRFPLTDEHKRKISIARLTYLHNNPDKVPYRLWNSNGYISYPHRKVMNVLDEMNIKGWISEFQFSIYSFDIAFPELKLDIEIDGSTHTRDKSIISDKRRDQYTQSHGWKVLRIPASHVVNNVLNVIDIIINTINTINPLYLSTFNIDDWNIRKLNYNNQKLLKESLKSTNIHFKCKNNNIISMRCKYCSNYFYVSSSKQLFCNKSCAAKYKHKGSTINRPTATQLINDIKQSSYLSVSKKYGVSDNAIRKWVKNYGFNPKTFEPID